ncbi:uncharacterized protein [Antedon mediterranea]|uniref:uncharacterized protein n=1 Tax=Antedon mediterranea TaxID=105859 RepID=UPI003AF89A1F
MHKMVRKCVIILLVFQFCDFTICQTEPVVTLQDAIAELGGDAVLNCHYTLSGKRILLGVQWYRSNSAGDQLDFLVNTQIKNQHGRYTVVASRKSAQIGTATLTIANTVLSDDGYYLCRIVDTTGEPGEHSANLAVYFFNSPTVPNSVDVNDSKNCVGMGFLGFFCGLFLCFLICCGCKIKNGVQKSGSDKTARNDK